MIRVLRDEAVSLLEGLVNAIPGRTGRLLRRLCYRTRFASCGAHLSIGQGADIRCPGNIRLGDRARFDRGIVLSACDRSAIEIGDDFGANGNVRIIADCGGNVTIGNKVIVGPNVVIRAADHATERVDLSIREQGHVAGKVVIGSDVWIGANVVVLRGASIGDRSVIGAGSVVTGDIPPLSIAVGMPARVIHQRRNPGPGDPAC